MGRKRDQEDVFKPLNDSPDDAAEESQDSGRGWEIKAGLLALVLVLAAAGYVAYTQLAGGEEAGQAADGSSRSELDTDAAVAAGNKVVPAHVPAVAEAVSEGEPLVMTQWNDVSGPEGSTEAETWTSSESEGVSASADSAEQTAALPYAASYGSKDPSEGASSAETTFAPMPNPDGFAAGSIAPDESQAAETPSAPGNMAPTASYDDFGPTQPSKSPTTSSFAEQSGNADASTAVPYAMDSTRTGTPEVPDASVAGEPSQESGREWNSAALRSPSPAQAPADGQNPDETPGYSPPERDVYAGPAGEASPYGGPETAAAPNPEPYQTYSPPAESKTQADYAGLSSRETAPTENLADTWQEPTVTPTDGKYTAQPNDNFYTISKKVYGSGAYFEALARYNKEKYAKPNQLRIGDAVQTPPAETLEARFPELCPKPEHRDAAKRRAAAAAGRSLGNHRFYVVQEGDSLFDIARFELGARSRVAELIELNRDILGDQIDYLTPGMRLVLPEAEGQQAPAITQRPTNTLR